MEYTEINEFDLIDSIVQNKNVDELFNLKNNSAFSIALHQILDRLYDKNPIQLNNHQINLFLSMHLENAGQSCSILSCLQEWYPQHLDKFVPALISLNARNCADVIEKAIKLLPQDRSWFFNNSTEESQRLMSKFDKKFSDYPDGNMPILYRKYAELNKNNIIKWD